VELTTTSSASPMIRALSADFVIKAYDYIANENTAGLYQMGLNDEAISCLVKMENKDLRLAIMAFEQALSIQTYVDPDIIKKVLVNNSKQKQEEVLINNLVRSGAGFEMIRYFVKTYTNRKHTQLRFEFGVTDLELNKKTSLVPEKTADDFFSVFLLNNQSINAQDLLTFAKENNYAMGSIWRELKKFINNGVDHVDDVDHG
jgi:hypothetical protein